MIASHLSALLMAGVAAPRSLQRGFGCFLTVLASSCSPVLPSMNPEPDQQPLPACATPAPESFPCRTPYDSAPVLLQRPPATESGRLATPIVWVFVDGAGAVRRTRIDVPAGVEFDVAAAAIARTLRFRPATLHGQPVEAWVRVPITTGPTLSCPTMLVPLSAGVAILVDSGTVARPEGGNLYRYADEAGNAFDVFVYPMASWPGPRQQANDFIEVIAAQEQEGRFTSVEVVDHGELDVAVTARGGTGVRFSGHQVLLRLGGPAGVHESFFAVFPSAPHYYKVRATYAPSPRVREQLNEFLRQLLSALASRDPRCS